MVVSVLSRPRMLDLFCGAGGSAVGYYRAGFDVVGVDIAPQPRYPFEFHQADALTFPPDGYDAVHASPPCQAHTTMSNRWRGQGGTADGHPELIGPTRARLEGSGVPWVMENVVGARAKMESALLLHGAMFGLQVHRPRLFESNVLLMCPQWVGGVPRGGVAVYGKCDGRRLWTHTDGTTLRAASSLTEARAAMGIDWMEWDELKEAIPPAYTSWLGAQLLGVVSVLSPHDAETLSAKEGPPS